MENHNFSGGNQQQSSKSSFSIANSEFTQFSMQKSSPFSNQIPLETHGALHSSAGGWDDHAESGAGAWAWGGRRELSKAPQKIW